MSFYGNIYQDIKDHFFSRIKFRDAASKQETAFVAESADDTLLFEAGEGLSFDTSGPDNEVSLTHESPATGWGKPTNPICFSGGDTVNSYDISKDTPDVVSLNFCLCDEFGHVHAESQDNFQFNFNINAEKQRRSELRTELNKYEPLYSMSKGPDGKDRTLYEIMRDSIDKQIMDKTLKDFCIIGTCDPNGIVILDTQTKDQEEQKIK